MITSIQGTLAASTLSHAIIELNGFGYEVNIPVTTAEKLSLPGANVKLHTLVIYREDAQTLYGFTTPAERDFFRLMIENVTGVGPKGALGIMGRLSLPRWKARSGRGTLLLWPKSPASAKKRPSAWSSSSVRRSARPTVPRQISMARPPRHPLGEHSSRRRRRPDCPRLQRCRCRPSHSPRRARPRGQSNDRSSHQKALN